MASAEDTELMEGLRQRDRAAGESLVRRFEAPLRRYFTVSLPGPDAADDAVQEVFLRFMAMVAAGRAQQVRSLDALIFTVARNLAHDARRRSGRRPALRSLEPESLDPDATDSREVACPRLNPRQQAEESEQAGRVESALRELDEETRDVIVLRHLENLSSREVAEILGIAEGTVWSRLHRGLNILRAKLAPRPVDQQEAPPSTPLVRRSGLQ